MFVLNGVDQSDLLRQAVSLVVTLLPDGTIDVKPVN
jgi:hypothetical protein